MEDVIQAASDPQISNKHGNVEDVQSWSDNVSGMRPGRNIEDVEREAINHLFRTNKDNSEHDPFSPLHNIRTYLHSQRAPTEVSPNDVLDATIDPITNRRVSRNSAVDPKSASYTPKFEDVDLHTRQDANKYGQVNWNEPDGLQKSTPEEESKKYNDLDKYKAKVDNPNRSRKLTPEERSKNYDDLGDYKPVRWNEPDGLQKPNIEEASKKYNDLDKYARSKFDNPNAPRKLTREERSKQYKDLGNYNAAPKWNEPNGLQEPTPEELTKNYQDLDSYGEVRWNEPDGLPGATREELTKDYNDLDSYGAMRYNEPDGLRKETPEEASKAYDDLNNYGAVTWNEPDGLQELTPEEVTKNYDDLGQYGPIRWNEPDGLQKPTLEELSKHYNDLGEYNAVRWSEPDGLRKLTPEELSKEYDDLKAYDGPRVAKDSVLEAHEARQMDPTPKGVPMPDKVEVIPEDKSKEYTDLHQYGPVRWNEPDGLQALTAEELTKNYEDLHLYGGPVKWNEPDGLPNLTPEEKSKKYADAPMYAPKESTGPEVIPVRRHPEEVSKDYKDLGSYVPVEWNEPYGQRKLTSEERSQKYPDLEGYAASTEASARRHPEEISKDYKDLYKYSQYENGDAAARVHPEEASKQYGDLDKYDPQNFDSPCAPYSMTSEEASKVYKDLDRYPATFKETGNKKRVHPEELTKVYEDLDRYDPQQFDSPSSAYPVHLEEASKNYQDLDKYTASMHNEPDGLPAEPKDGTSKGLAPYDAKVRSQQDSPRGQAISPESSMDPVDQLTAQDIRADVLRKVRESSRKWKPEDSKALHEQSRDAVSKAAQDDLRNLKPTLTENYARDFPEDSTRVWTKTGEFEGLLPKEQVKGELEEAGCSSLDESFPCETSKLETALNRLRRSQPEKEDFVVYKILAYDPATESINVAEISATLSAPSPLPPADLILRLSNPSKFLPHLTPLHSQGYEITSGNANVLILRKVRPNTIPSPEPSSKVRIPFKPRINPIDMMGSVTSPTGFVNYDVPTPKTEKPAPPSDIPKEPVQKTTKGRSLRRRIGLGLAWGAGVAYATGVVGEYVVKRPGSKVVKSSESGP